MFLSRGQPLSLDTEIDFEIFLLSNTERIHHPEKEVFYAMCLESQALFDDVFQSCRQAIVFWAENGDLNSCLSICSQIAMMLGNDPGTDFDANPYISDLLTVLIPIINANCDFVYNDPGLDKEVVEFASSISLFCPFADDRSETPPFRLPLVQLAQPELTPAHIYLFSSLNEVYREHFAANVAALFFDAPNNLIPIVVIDFITECTQFISEKTALTRELELVDFMAAKVPPDKLARAIRALATTSPVLFANDQSIEQFLKVFERSDTTFAIAGDYAFAALSVALGLSRFVNAARELLGLISSRLSHPVESFIELLRSLFFNSDSWAKIELTIARVELLHRFMFELRIPVKHNGRHPKQVSGAFPDGWRFGCLHALFSAYE
jgi:hypothetical protein